MPKSRQQILAERAKRDSKLQKIVMSQHNTVIDIEEEQILFFEGLEN